MKVINADSWHCKLFGKSIWWWNNKNHVEYKMYYNSEEGCRYLNIDRCSYLKGILKVITKEAFKAIGVYLGTAILGLLPFGVFALYYKQFDAMVVLTMLLAGIGLSVLAIKIKRRIFGKRDRVSEKFASFAGIAAETVIDFFDRTKRNLCPVLEIRRYEK